MILEAALRYASHGTPVFPVNFSNKHPLCEHGLKDASVDVDQIRFWWRIWPRAMIGIPTGPRSGWWAFDVDFDPSKGIDGYASMARLEAEHGPLSSTLCSITPRGGKHHLFLWQNGTDIRSSTSKIGPGLDVRGDGGYFVAPPSVRIDGAAYRWENEGCGVVEAPGWLVELALKAKPPVRRAIIDLNDLDGAPQQGSSLSSARDHAWARAALLRECAGLGSNYSLYIAAFNLGQIVGGGELSERQVFSALLGGAEDCGLIVDYGEPSAIRTITSGLEDGKKHPRYRPR